MEAGDQGTEDFTRWELPAEPPQAPSASVSLAVMQTVAPIARKRTPQQLERQHRVFQLSIAGQSTRAIGKELKIAPATVRTDIMHEQELRADEIRERKDTEIARAVSFYENVIRNAERKSNMADTLIASGSEHVNVTDRYLDTALKARERIDKLLGLDAPIRVDVGVAALLAAIDEGVPE